MQNEHAELAAMRKALHADRLELAQAKSALHQRTAKIGALLKSETTDIRVVLRGSEVHIPLAAIQKYPNSVLAGLCEYIKEPEVKLPEKTSISLEALRHVANFYNGSVKDLYSAFEAHGIMHAADFMGLPELKEHVEAHSDQKGSALVASVTTELANVTQSMKALQEAIAPAKGWRYCVKTKWMDGTLHDSDMEPVGLTALKHGQTDILFRGPGL